MTDNHLNIEINNMHTFFILQTFRNIQLHPIYLEK
jgi:hypothetical protein